MKFLKHILKWVALVTLIMLAVLGIGLTGAAPLSLNKGSREIRQEARVEIVEERTNIARKEKR